MVRFRWVLVIGTVLAFLAIAPIAGAAAPNTGNAHFIKSQTTATTDGSGNLVASFKETGLSAGSTETITLTATQTVTYECVNGGGKNPSASNKHSITTTSSNFGNFPVDRNGNLVASLTVPVAPDTVGCPPGQTDTLVSVVYSNITLKDSTSGAQISLADVSYTNHSAPPLR